MFLFRLSFPTPILPLLLISFTSDLFGVSAKVGVFPDASSSFFNNIHMSRFLSKLS